MRHKYTKVSFRGGYDRTKAMKRALVRNFIMTGSVTVTAKRAKYIKQKIDGLVLRARRYSGSDKQTLRRFFGETRTIDKLQSLEHIMKSKRVSGMVSLTKMNYRAGDASLMVKVSWIDAPEVKTLPKEKNEKK